jgi:transcriptional antiterminator Rof (Rho-off)
VAVSPLDGLKISSQSWRRGGLGSKALVTLTLRNGNDFAVKDIEIACSFARRDGSHLTDRKRVIGEAVDMKSRKTFSRVHVGFVNVNADKAKCSLVAANRV